MNYQVLRGAIFAFVDELEARVLGIGTAISEGVSRLIETAFDAGLNLVEGAIEEGFNLFRAVLTVVLGQPDIELSFDDIVEKIAIKEFDTGSRHSLEVGYDGSKKEDN